MVGVTAGGWGTDDVAVAVGRGDGRAVGETIIVGWAVGKLRSGISNDGNWTPYELAPPDWDTQETSNTARKIREKNL